MNLKSISFLLHKINCNFNPFSEIGIVYLVFRSLIVSTITFSLFCSTARVVKPLPEKSLQAGFSMGGPLVDLFDTVIPVPLSSVYGSYGFSENLTFTGSMGVTSLVFGTIQMETGGLYGLIKPDKWIPGLSVYNAYYFLLDRWEWNFKFYPTIDMNIYWNTAQTRDDFVYMGVGNWFELATKRGLNEKQKHHWLPSLYAGYTYAPGKWMLTLEAKYLAPFIDNQNKVITYHGINHSGAFGTYINVARNF